MKLLLIGAGGFLGSILRYLLSGFAQSITGSAAFPVGTLTVNFAGCLAIGFLWNLSETYGVLTGSTRAFLIVGVLGGFTTFSAFANETFNLLRDAEKLFAILNVVGHIVLCLFAVWLGRAMVHWIWR